MQTVPDKVALTAGQDASSHAWLTQQQVAVAATKATGQVVETSQTVPPVSEGPKIVDPDLMEKAPAELDLEDVIEGEKGKPRTEPSRGFLKMFLERLKKKTPGSVIVEK